MRASAPLASSPLHGLSMCRPASTSAVYDVTHCRAMCTLSACRTVVRRGPRGLTSRSLGRGRKWTLHDARPLCVCARHFFEPASLSAKQHGRTCCGKAHIPSQPVVCARTVRRRRRPRRRRPQVSGSTERTSGLKRSLRHLTAHMCTQSLHRFRPCKTKRAARSSNGRRTPAEYARDTIRQLPFVHRRLSRIVQRVLLHI